MANTIAPVGATLGILGGGQLGRMMAIAAREMGIHTVIWDPGAESPAFEAADAAIIAPYGDPEARERFLQQVDRITYEFENVDFETARTLARSKPVHPSPNLLHVSQHRLREKDRARQAGLATTPYAAVTTVHELERAMGDLGLPAILKTVQGGYDGKGQVALWDRASAMEGFRDLQRASRGQTLIYERRADFVAEISVVVARDEAGRIVTYPVTENHHHHGILDYSVVPARVPAEVATRAQQAVAQLASHLELVGLMAMELFVMADGRVLFNEMAPRPHNSGHWTLDAAWPTQFTQHVRAVMGWPVAEPRLLSAAVMVNLLGDSFLEGLESMPDLLELPGVQLHWYGKREMRAGRKVGHVNVLADNVEAALEVAREVKSRIGGRCNDGA